MEGTHLIKIRACEGGFQWFIILVEPAGNGQYLLTEICRSTAYKTETKCVVDALYYGALFRMEVITPQEEKPKSRHLRLVENPDDLLPS